MNELNVLFKTGLFEENSAKMTRFFGDLGLRSVLLAKMN